MEDWIQHLLDEETGTKTTEKKRAIMMAAVELISENGYEKVSTAEIAKQAGVAEGTIFRHFKTKRDLLQSIVVPTSIRFIAPMMMQSFKKQVLDKEYVSFETFIEVLLVDRYELIKKATPLIRILFQEVMLHEDMRTQLEQLFIEQAYPSFHKVITHFQQRGEVVQLPTMTVFRIIITNGLGYFIPRFILFPKKEWDDEKELKQVVETIVKALKP